MNKNKQLKSDSFQKGNFDLDSLRDKLIDQTDQNIENDFQKQQTKQQRQDKNKKQDTNQIISTIQNQAFLKIGTIGPIYWTKMYYASSTSQLKWQSQQTELKQIKKVQQNLSCNGDGNSQTKPKDLLKNQIEIKKNQEQEYSQTIWINKDIEQNFNHLPFDIDEELKMFLQYFLVQLRERLNLSKILSQLIKPWLIIVIIFAYSEVIVVILYFLIYPYIFQRQLMSENQMNIFLGVTIIIMVIIEISIFIILTKSMFKQARILHQEMQKINVCFREGRNYFQTTDLNEIQQENHKTDNFANQKYYKLLQEWRTQMNRLKFIQLKLKQSNFYNNCFGIYQYVQVYQKKVEY